MTKFSRQARGYVSEESIQSALATAALPRHSWFSFWLRCHWLEFKFNLLLYKALRLRTKLIRTRAKLSKAVQELTKINEDLRRNHR